MILRLSSQILKDRLFPIPLHVIPIINHSMADRIVNTISWRLLVRDSFVSNEEIQVLSTKNGPLKAIVFVIWVDYTYTMPRIDEKEKTLK